MFGLTLTRSLKHRNFRLFFFGQGVSQIGTWLSRVATSWLVYRLSHSAWMLGVMTFASLIPTFVFAPFAGVLADRWNKHRALVITQVLALLHVAAMAVLTLLNIITLPEILILSVFQGFINAFDFPIRQSLVVQMVDDRADLPNAIALNASMVNLARLLGPSCAGILIAAFGEGGCFAVDAVSYLAVIATLLVMNLPKHLPATGKAKNLFLELKDGLRYAKNSREIVSVVSLLALVSFMGIPYMTLLPMIVDHQLSSDAATLGYLTGSAGCGAMVGMLYLASRKTAEGLSRVVMCGALIFGAGLILFGMSHSFWISMPTIFIVGLGMTVQAASTNTLMQTVVEESKRGRVMSLFVMAYAGATPFGSLVGGYMADRIGAGVTLILGGVVCCLGGLAYMLYHRPKVLSVA